MSREWTPGDVAMVRNEHGVWNVAIRQVGFGFDEWQYGVARTIAPRNAEARPLVVVDPEDRESVERVVDAYVDIMQADGRSGDKRGAVLKMQAALRSLVEPPTPETPAELLHAVMYRDGALGTLCDSSAYGSPVKATADAMHVTCPGCNEKLEGARAKSSARQSRIEVILVSPEGVS